MHLHGPEEIAFSLGFVQCYLPSFCERSFRGRVSLDQLQGERPAVERQIYDVLNLYAYCFVLPGDNWFKGHKK